MDAAYKEFLAKNKGKTSLYMKLTDHLDPNDFKTVTFINFSSGNLSTLELPVWLKNMTQLEKLDIEYLDINNIPDWLEELINLRILHLSTNNIKEIPSVLSKLPKLEELHLGSCPIKNLPSPNVEFKSLKQFHLDPYVRGNPDEIATNREILDWLMHLPRLESYTIVPMSLKYSYGRDNPDVYYFDKFLASLSKKRPTLLGKDNLDPSAIKLLCWMFRKDKSELEKADKNQFYSLLNCSVAKYRDMVLEYLNDLPKDGPQNIKGKNVFILGKLKIKKAEYSDWLEETGAVLQKKLGTNTDYVILGEQPKDKLQEVLDSNIPILMEKDVWNIKDSAFLKEEAPVMTENLESLLVNEDLNNVEVGLTIMEKGGVPKDLRETMIGIMLCHKNSKIRKKTKVIFDRYNEEKFSESTQKQLAKPAYRMRDDKKVTNFLRDLVADTSLDLDKLAYAVYIASGKEQAQGLCLMMPNSSKKVLEDYITKEGYNKGFLVLKPHTRLDNGLYLEHFPACIEEFAKRPNAKLEITSDTVIKEDSEYLRLQGLEELKIALGRARKIPPNLFKITSLKVLNMTNYSASKLPPTVSHLQNLVELDLYLSGMKKFPKEMSDLTKLIDININWGDNVDTIPPFIYKQTDLKYLRIGNKMKEFPKEMETLKNLERLSVALTENCPPEDVERLQTMKEEIAKKV